MRVAELRTTNFRCLHDLEVAFDDVTVLVGANSTGKSSVLHALDWFFSGGPLTDEDVSGHEAGQQVSVVLTFRDLDPTDRKALGAFVIGSEARFERVWSADDGERLFGVSLAYPGFAAVRAEQKAMRKRDAYKALRDERPDLGLPTAAKADAVDEALASWESEHPDQLREGRLDASHLTGRGQSGLGGRFDFVLIPALADPDAETSDGRGTLLRQLLDRKLGSESRMRDQLDELEQRFSDEVSKIVEREGAAALGVLSTEVSDQLAQLIPGGAVSLHARPPAVRLPEVSVDVRVVDDGLSTVVRRQGHGFQRALLIAVVQQLAAVSASGVDSDDKDERGSAPALLLAIEEPELYQHPLQARHFAAALAELTEPSSGAPVQVTYATHSEHFVDPANYERLRRFRRIVGGAWPRTAVTRATVEAVAARLQEVVEPEEIPTRIKLTLRRQVNEAVFAKAVLLVEGPADVGLFQGVADRTGGFDADGIAVVGGGGKSRLLIPWAILTELGVPTYVVFDGDAGIKSRALAKGKSEQKALQAEQHAGDQNELLLRTLGVLPERHPPTTFQGVYSVFSDRLEEELAGWQGFVQAIEVAREEHGEFRDKPDDLYRLVAGTTDQAPPPIFEDIVGRVRAMAA